MTNKFLIQDPDKTLQGWSEFYEETKEHLRKGQSFVVYYNYINMPILFYERDDDKAQSMIDELIKDYQLT